jgi:CDP-glycerol glycerophosphotransferase (TagB/SpsB family)
VHPEDFFREASLIFAENSITCDRLLDRFQLRPWFQADKFVVSGSPKLDYIVAGNGPYPVPWKRRIDATNMKVLWTPRWWTNDGTCHFFDYRSFFESFCSHRQSVDFVFRPHPLSIQNFLNTGELTREEWQGMETHYAASPNMAIDHGGEYRGAFLTSDVLVTDISSLMMEYLITGKPIIYTHRLDLFNELGRKLSDGFYWVRNAEQLAATLEMLLSGSDPLGEKRKGLIDQFFFMPEGGAGSRIKDMLKAHFRHRDLTLMA